MSKRILHKIAGGVEIRNGKKPLTDLEKRYARYKREWIQLSRGEKPRTWTPWLLIRYALTDIGLRPVPASEKTYKSPDIRIESSDPLGNAVAGELNYIHAKIFNLGKADAVPVKVDFYWGDPSLGLGAEHMNLVGTEWVQVRSHTSVDVRCNTPWVPVFVNKGHECLKVNCSNPILDPIMTPFDPSQ